jgi:chorismate synthase
LSNTSIPTLPNDEIADTKNNSVTEYSIKDSIDSIEDNKNNHNTEDRLNTEYKDKDNTDSTDSIDKIDSIDDREDSIGDSVNVAATKPPQPTAPQFFF